MTMTHAQVITKIVEAPGMYRVLVVLATGDTSEDNVRLYRNRSRVLPSRVGEGVFEWRGPLATMDLIEASTGDWAHLRLSLERLP
jgi:hypothetical protein